MGVNRKSPSARLRQRQQTIPLLWTISAAASRQPLARSRAESKPAAATAGWRFFSPHWLTAACCHGFHWRPTGEGERRGRDNVAADYLCVCEYTIKLLMLSWTCVHQLACLYLGAASLAGLRGLKNRLKLVKWHGMNNIVFHGILQIQYFFVITVSCEYYVICK